MKSDRKKHKEQLCVRVLNADDDGKKHFNVLKTLKYNRITRGHVTLYYRSVQRLRGYLRSPN